MHQRILTRSIRQFFSLSPYLFRPRFPTYSYSSGVIGPGPDYVVGSPARDIELPKEDLYRTVSNGFSKHGSKIAIVDVVTGREYSYTELDEKISIFSSSLQKMGFVRGDVMCVVSPNNPEYPVVYLGTLRCGGVVSTCNPTFTANELAFQFQNSNAKTITTVPECLPSVQEAAARSKIEKIIVIDSADPQPSSGMLMSYQSLAKNCGPILNAVHTDVHDVAVLPYSSGTTGFPKGVMLTNSNVASNIFQMIHPEWLDFQSNPSTCLMGVLPFFHIYGMVVVLLSSLYCGSKYISLPKFEPEMFLNAIEKYKINIAPLVPPLILFLAKHSSVEKYDLSSLEDIIVAAAPLGGEVVKTAVDRTKCKLIRQAYGLTEMSPITHMMPRSLGAIYPGSVGQCLRSSRAMIVDPDTHKPLPPNKEGEMWISGPHVMKGYLNNPEATNNCIVEGGWFKTGDIGYCDEQGLFYITDRLKELIKVKGFQVAPAELEAVLVTHPKIADVAVIGVANERLGEAPRAFVVKGDGTLTEKEVEEFVSQNLTKHKHLAGGVRFVDAIPKSPSGKILRRVLREMNI